MTRNQRAIALLLLASLNAFGFIDRVVIALVTEKIKAEFRVSDLDIGLLGGTGFAVINALAAVPIARLAERNKRSYVTAGFLLIGSAFTALMGLCANFTQLLAARLGMAVGSAATEAPPHSMISDLYPPEKRASAISLFMQLVLALVQVLPQLLTTLVGMLPVILTTLIGMIPSLLSTVINLFLQLVIGLLTVLPQLLVAIVGMLRR